MKIGILTFHKPINYGAFLQSFALSQKISEENPEHDVEIVDYIAPLEKRKIIINVLWGIKHYGITNGVRDCLKIRSFNSVYGKLPLSKQKKFKSLTDLYQFIDKTYDLLIIGSDAVFNWKQNGYPTAFIPTFAFQHCKVVTYAASVHGLRYLEEPEERLIECGNVFSRMSLIGVRDTITEKFVLKCCKTANVVHCCDPTVVINIEKLKQYAGVYEGRIHKKYKCDLNRDYIVLMMPDCLFTEKLKKAYGDKYQFITLFKPSRDADIYLYDLNPFEWAMVLSKAKLVVTSYFHGTLLSLRQNTPVLAVDFSNYNDDNYEGKLNDLMCSRLNLPECYYESKFIDDSTMSMMLQVAETALAGEYNQRISDAMHIEATAYESYFGKLWSKLATENRV